MKLPPLSLVVLDTETTGFLPRVHHIMEFASIRIENGEIVDTYEQLLAVPDEIPQHIEVLTRIRPEMLAGKPKFAEKSTEILQHIGEETLIAGQNIPFDLGMLKGEGLDLTERPCIDTASLASLVFPELSSYSLGYVSKALKLQHEPAHRALGDVRATLELLSRCWERLLELPADYAAVARELFGKSSPGYKRLFAALPETTGTAKWLELPPLSKPKTDHSKEKLSRPAAGAVELCPEGLSPDILEHIIAAAKQNKDGTHWVAVKNLEAALRRLPQFDENVRVLHPSFLMLDPDAALTMADQKELTPDEANIGTKLAWWRPRTRAQISVHGGEREVWSGKLAATEKTPAYREQFENPPKVLLLDHRQLLAFLADADHPGNRLLAHGKSHVIVDDASMLEDTATKAYGQQCRTGDLRAAAHGDPEMTIFADLLEIWIGRVRGAEDSHVIQPQDLARPEVRGLLGQARTLRARGNLGQRIDEQLADLCLILQSDLHTRVVWIEGRKDNTFIINAAPESIDVLLDALLYAKYPTTLLIPPGSDDMLPQILPENVLRKTRAAIDVAMVPPTLTFPEGQSVGELLENPPPGKTIMLLQSKRLIEGFFIRFTEVLENRGIALICQGLSGGQGRMEEEFIAAEGTAIWLLTPWTYEGVELPPGTVDRLIVETVPFDVPSRAVIARRSKHFKNAFEEYLLPRLLHRLFRVFRTFCRHRKASGDIAVLDNRLRDRGYGPKVRAYLESLVASDAKPVEKKMAKKKEEKPKEEKTKKDQMTLF